MSELDKLLETSRSLNLALNETNLKHAYNLGLREGLRGSQANYGHPRPMDTAPRDGRFVLLFGDSGYTTTPLRCEVGCWDDESLCWRDHGRQRFTDGGAGPSGWLPLPGTSSVEGHHLRVSRLPWRVDPVSGCICDAHGEYLTGELSPANAEFVVASANAYGPAL